MKNKLASRLINSITIYRIAITPILLFFIFIGSIDLFKWFLAISFFTDLIDGTLARKYKVASVLGARLDSIGDDLTIISAVIGLFAFRINFIKEEVWIIGTLLALFLLQTIMALVKYKRVTSFHTYLAKIGAIFQGVFLILIFFFPEPIYILFYAAAIITMLDLIEEIILVIIIPKWVTNIKGLYWVKKNKKKETVFKQVRL